MKWTNTFYRKLRGILRHPLWLDGPSNLQFDTTGRCNLDCVYCNPQHGSWTPPYDMEFDIIQDVFDEFHGYPLWSVAPFMNGEPLLYGGLTAFLDLTQEYGFHAVLDTNGTVIRHRDRLIHPALKVVRITISAATANIYRAVHGAYKFSHAIDTINWFQRHKLPNQELWLHFIENTLNTHEREKWLHDFHDIHRSVWPIHFNEGQPQSLKTVLPKIEPLFSMRANSTTKIMYPNKDVPCQCWNILAIDHDGTILQCPDVPGDVNYGKVGEVNLLDAWRRRNENAMSNKYCLSCNLRMPHAFALFKKHGFTGAT